jgi:hypothetical protein
LKLKQGEPSRQNNEILITDDAETLPDKSRTRTSHVIINEILHKFNHNTALNIKENNKDKGKCMRVIRAYIEEIKQNPKPKINIKDLSISPISSKSPINTRVKEGSNIRPSTQCNLSIS